jgi:hypothetical protein
METFTSVGELREAEAPVAIFEELLPMIPVADNSPLMSTPRREAFVDISDCGHN